MPKLQDCLKIRVQPNTKAQRLLPTCPECGEPIAPGTIKCGTTWIPEILLQNPGKPISLQENPQ